MVDNVGVAPERRAGNFFDRYWRGEVPLPVASGLAVILAVVGFFLSVAGRYIHGLVDLHPVAMLVVALLPFPLLVLFLILQVVGLWRSGSRYGREGRSGSRFLGSLAGKALAGLCILWVGYLAAVRTGPQLVQFYHTAFLDDLRLPDGEFTLLAGGKELSFQGGIKYGAAEELASALEAAPDVRVLHLYSPGGRLRDALKLAQLVKERRLETYVSNECLSACTIVFAAGEKRWLADAAALGFHGVALPDMTEREKRASNEEWAAIYRSFGVEPSFIDKALASPSDNMWFPTFDELMTAKLVTGIDHGENFQSTGHEAVPTLAEVAEHMRRNDSVIDTLDQVAPALARRIYVRMRKGLVAGEPSEQTLSDIEIWVEELIRKATPTADDQAIIELAPLLADRYQAVLDELGATECFSYMEGGHLPKNVLTEELESRTVAVYQKILRSATERPAPDPALVDAALTKLAELMTDEWVLVLRKPPSELSTDEHEPYCQSKIALFRGIARLPPDEASAIMRHVFRRGQER